MTVGRLAGHLPLVLLADDDKSFALGLALLLRPDILPLVACGSAEALAVCLRNPPRAAVIDLEMPAHFGLHDGVEGVHLARELRRRLGRDLPVLLLTRSEPSEIAPEHLAQVQAVFRKPLHAGELASRLAALLSPSGRLAGSPR